MKNSDEGYIQKAVKAGIKSITLIFFNAAASGSFIRNTLSVDKIKDQEEAFIDIYKRMRPGEQGSKEVAEAFFQSTLF